MSTIKVAIIYGGELAQDVAEQMKSKAPSSATVALTVINAGELRPKKLVDDSDNSTKHDVLCFIMQTIENGAPTEEGSTVTRFFKRKTHPNDLLNDKQFAVLGVGDSNLLLDRQTTTAKDCNQVGQELDTRLEALGGQRRHPLCMADERTGLEEVEPWIESFWQSFQ